MTRQAETRRPTLFALIAAAHLAAIWLLLRPSPPSTPDGDRPALALFDIQPPRAPPEPPPPPRRSAAARDGAPEGGSPGTRRERPALRTEMVAPPARAAMDATPSPIAPPSLPLLAAGTSPIDLGAGGAGGHGEGAGSGTGSGSGDGGGEKADVFARAEWVKRPQRASYERHWPRDRSFPDYPVTVRVSCHVRRNGTPYRCRHVSESPRRAGFREMVRLAVLDAKVRPVGRNGDLLWDVPVLIEVVLDRLIAAPPITAAASAPPSPARP